MAFVQGKRVKVSLFLQYHMQTQDGMIVLDGVKGAKLPFGSEPVGTVRLYEGGTVVSSRQIPIDDASSVVIILCFYHTYYLNCYFIYRYFFTFPFLFF